MFDSVAGKQNKDSSPPYFTKSCLSCVMSARACADKRQVVIPFEWLG